VELAAVYCERNSKPICKFYGKSANILILKEVEATETRKITVF
jgi:hypothetical protein